MLCLLHVCQTSSPSSSASSSLTGSVTAFTLRHLCCHYVHLDPLIKSWVLVHLCSPEAETAGTASSLVFYFRLPRPTR